MFPTWQLTPEEKRKLELERAASAGPASGPPPPGPPAPVGAPPPPSGAPPMPPEISYPRTTPDMGPLAGAPPMPVPSDVNLLPRATAPPVSPPPAAPPPSFPATEAQMAHLQKGPPPMPGTPGGERIPWWRNLAGAAAAFGIGYAGDRRSPGLTPELGAQVGRGIQMGGRYPREAADYAQRTESLGGAAKAEQDMEQMRTNAAYRDAMSRAALQRADASMLSAQNRGAGGAGKGAADIVKTVKGWSSGESIIRQLGEERAQEIGVDLENRQRFYTIMHRNGDPIRAVEGEPGVKLGSTALDPETGLYYRSVLGWTGDEVKKAPGLPPAHLTPQETTRSTTTLQSTPSGQMVPVTLPSRSVRRPVGVPTTPVPPATTPGAPQTAPQGAPAGAPQRSFPVAPQQSAPRASGGVSVGAVLPELGKPIPQRVIDGRNSLMAARGRLDAITKVGDSLFTESYGPFAKAKGLKQSVGAWLNTDEKARAYQSLLNAARPALGRIVGGDVGNLSAWEQQWALDNLGGGFGQTEAQWKLFKGILFQMLDFRVQLANDVIERKIDPESALARQSEHERKMEELVADFETRKGGVETGVPTPGSTFQGSKVKRVTKIQ